VSCQPSPSNFEGPSVRITDGAAFVPVLKILNMFPRAPPIDVQWAPLHFEPKSKSDESVVLALESVDDARLLVDAVRCPPPPSLGGACDGGERGGGGGGGLSEETGVRLCRRVTRLVKVWGRRNGVYGSAFGFPGGFAWSVLVASMIVRERANNSLVWQSFQAQRCEDGQGERPTTIPQRLIFFKRLIATCASWSWACDAVSVVDFHSTASCASRPVRVLTPRSCRNSCRSVSVTTLDVIQAEIAAANLSLRVLSTLDELERLWGCLPRARSAFFTAHKFYLCLEVRAPNGEPSLDDVGLP
jgi:hypothetical protein